MIFGPRIELWVTVSLIEHSNDVIFLAKYTEASGNPRDSVWRVLLGTLET